jgi:NAD(P)-dependent dehydrogenase (short-subunit alcohol dehydrogenase family)
MTITKTLFPDHSGKNILITGATSGLGYAAAIKLAIQGAHVFVLARNAQKGATLIDDIKTNHPYAKGKIEIISCDLGDLSSITPACQKVRKTTTQLDMIIHNAGVLNMKFKETADKIEETWQVNVLAPLLITHLLMDLLVKSADPKLIFTSSALHQGKINFENPEWRNQYGLVSAYRHSKLSLILLAKLLAEKLKAYNVGVYCQHPGFVRTGLGDTNGWMTKMAFKLFGKSPEEGSKTLLYLTDTSNSELENGAYYARSKVKSTTKESYEMETASELLRTVQKYLKEYIHSSSLVFDGES